MQHPSQAQGFVLQPTHNELSCAATASDIDHAKQKKLRGNLPSAKAEGIGRWRLQSAGRRQSRTPANQLTVHVLFALKRFLSCKTVHASVLVVRAQPMHEELSCASKRQRKCKTKTKNYNASQSLKCTTRHRHWPQALPRPMSSAGACKDQSDDTRERQSAHGARSPSNVSSVARLLLGLTSVAAAAP